MDLTVAQLKELIRNAKRSNKTCVSYSRMRKSELYNHAVNLGLIRGKEKKRSMSEDDKLFQKLKKLYKKSKKLNPITKNGKDKMKYLLKKIEKMSDLWENFSLKDKNANLSRLERLYSYVLTI